MEIVELKMNGDQLIDHLIHCATLAIPHESKVIWNAHARTICVNKSDNTVLNLMTDFSAVLDHDVQDKLNTAIPCRSNQCIFLSTHSPRTVVLTNGSCKRVQQNDVWHFWSAQGGVLEGNSYYHSVCTKYIIDELADQKLKRVNIFTDGCAEQYKSRRNAYFVGQLAETTGMIVTHNYAPTASFKTMVDGQGNVTKSLYRELERSEEEGTRCHTSYQLFLLFASKYPITPLLVDDSNKNPMTITNRYHRFLVDICDATPEMILRAEVEKDVLLTDYIGKRWDAHPIKGIKSLFSLIAKAQDGQVKLFSREHACFCKDCMEGNFSSCQHSEISGPLKEEPFVKLPFKEAPVKKSCTEEELQRVNFFKGNLIAGSGGELFVAVKRGKLDMNDEPFVLAIMTKKIKECTKDIEFEYTALRLKSKVVIKRDTWCFTLKLLYSKNHTENIYYIPVKEKEFKMPLSDVYFPDEEEGVTRETYITCVTQCVLYDNNQNSTEYIIDSSSIEKLRNAMADQG